MKLEDFIQESHWLNEKADIKSCERLFIDWENQMFLGFFKVEDR